MMASEKASVAFKFSIAAQLNSRTDRFAMETLKSSESVRLVMMTRPYICNQKSDIFYAMTRIFGALNDFFNFLVGFDVVNIFRDIEGVSHFSWLGSHAVPYFPLDEVIPLAVRPATLQCQECVRASF